MSYNPFSLDGKKVLVTGASSGIGRAIAVAASGMGARLVITGRNSERLDETLKMLHGGGHTACVADLTKPDGISGLAGSLPELDGAVHNMGVNYRMTCRYVKESAMSYVIDTNFKAVVMLQKELMKAGRIKPASSIVFISSRATVSPTAGNGIYAASKAALTAYSKSLALEVAPKGIRVNSVHPGMVWTELLSGTPLSDEQYREDEKRYPLGRYGTPEDVANVVVYLLSDASSWMTGSSVVIDGGRSLV